MDDEIEKECHTVEVCFFMFIVLGLRHDGKNVQVYRYAEMKVYTCSMLLLR